MIIREGERINEAALTKLNGLMQERGYQSVGLDAGRIFHAHVFYPCFLFTASPSII